MCNGSGTTRKTVGFEEDTEAFSEAHRHCCEGSLGSAVTRAMAWRRDGQRALCFVSLLCKGRDEGEAVSYLLGKPASHPEACMFLLSLYNAC